MVDAGNLGALSQKFGRGLMTLKEDMIRSGYLPENMPPPFHTEDIASFFSGASAGYLSSDKVPVRSSTYSTSKRGISRRNFAVVHPVTSHDLAEFVEKRSTELYKFFERSKYSLSVPYHTPDDDRAVEIASHARLEKERLLRLSGYRFIAKTDISRFYHSIYTHSVAWAFHGKAAAKKVRRYDAEDIYFNRLDFTLRQGQDGQTIGIPVGPDASRFVAELINTAVDVEFASRCDVSDFAVVRHVDDVWIGTHSHADAERCLWRYRESLREFELDINESKTHIYSANFRFTDAWPSDVTSRLELALQATENRREERLRAALEFAFDLTVSSGDDGILKYAIRQLDQSEQHWDAWATLQPFLMRSAVHFGHTVDYVARVLVWRKLTKDDLDGRWTAIVHSMLDHHGRLGNDSETCWLLFAALQLNIVVPEDVAERIVRNCGPLSIVSILNCVEANLVKKSIFNSAFDILSHESADGKMWPIFLEWGAKSWDRHAEVKALVGNEVINGMSDKGVSIFGSSRLTRVFHEVDKSEYGGVVSAIESRMSSYDDNEEEGESVEEEVDTA